MRSALAWPVGAAVAFFSAVVLGEYAFTGLVPYAAAAVVPSLVVAVMTGVDRPRPARWWRAAAVLGAGGIALGVWFAGGRGLQPWPTGGTVAIVLAGAWPLGVSLWRTRHRAPVAARR